jgi:hypothetical protein
MHEFIGWIGALLYVIASFLLSINKLRADKLPYQLLNIFGGICLIINSTHQKDYPSIVTNAVWATIGLFAIFITERNNLLFHA